ncbi:glycosyltransferase family A protein [Leeuwenhoekiella sp. A2]|uniref:glycosyltransferase family A protein n=1 Tax=Leeuwenhoekiella sp. A2 TaxID=3141460 RepID=UPI003A80B879
MRAGVNPEKYKLEKNKKFYHRIIMPVYIPNVEEEYYQNMPLVLKIVLEQLFNTINPLITSVTLINNNSCQTIEKVILSFLSKINKYVKYSENKGKVNAVLTEARGAYEPFITIVDADVILIAGWENAVFSIFRQFPKAGVVAPLPCPGLAFNHNSSVFYEHYLFGKIKYDQILEKKDIQFYLEGLGNPAILNRDNRPYHWYEKQYYLDNNGIKAIIGAGHFVATYRAQLFKKENNFPELKFKNGYENEFIDILADKYGYYRLSTITTYAYHLGNSLDDNVKELCKMEGSALTFDLISPQKKLLKRALSPFIWRQFFFKVLKKVLKL